jgi:Domain of unknown function (DUF1707)
VTGSGADDAQEPRSAVRASDADRAAVVARLQTALGEGRIDLDEFGQRAAVASDATTLAELDGVVADLPTDGRPPVEIVGTRTPEVVSTVFGDIRLSGGSAPQRVSGVFGDIKLDLRGLRTDADRLDLYLSTMFGDVEVIVAEGVDAELHGRTLFGDRRTDLAPVPRLPGTPRIVVHARTAFGDLRLRSLAPGESPSRWRALMDRLSQWMPPPPPDPPRF